MQRCHDRQKHPSLSEDEGGNTERNKERMQRDGGRRRTTLMRRGVKERVG